MNTSTEALLSSETKELKMATSCIAPPDEEFEGDQKEMQDDITRQSSFTSGASPASFRSATSATEIHASHVNSGQDLGRWCSRETLETTNEAVINAEVLGDSQPIAQMLRTSLCDLTRSFKSLALLKDNTPIQRLENPQSETDDPLTDFTAYVSAKQAASSLTHNKVSLQPPVFPAALVRPFASSASAPQAQYPSPLSTVALDDLVVDQPPKLSTKKISPFPKFFTDPKEPASNASVSDLLESTTDVLPTISPTVSLPTCSGQLEHENDHQTASTSETAHKVGGSCSDKIASSPQADAALSFFHAPTETRETLNTIVDEASRLGHSPDSPRPAANVPEQQLEALDKTSIFMVYQGSCTPVSWFSDTGLKDVREMILCGCDAIVDRGFVLREVHPFEEEKYTRSPEDASAVPLSTSPEALEMELDGHRGTFRYTLGRRYEFEDFHELKSGGIYMLQPATERLDLKTITGDRWRRFKLRIDPLLHFESMKAIDIMRRGTNLLRHSEQGYPHLRQFQLSSDCKRLLWYSAQDGGTTAVWVDTIQEIALGQNSALFRRYKLPALEHLSFSIYYDGSESPITKSVSKLLPLFTDRQPWLQSLDLTCKDETEFDHWVCGLKALAFHAHKLKISKEELLSHSRQFKKAVKTADSTLHCSNRPETNGPGTLGLEECLELPLHSPSELHTKRERLLLSLARLEKKIEEFDKTYQHTYLETANNLVFPDPQTAIPKPSPKASLDALPATAAAPYDLTLSNSVTPNAAAFEDLSKEEDDRLEYLRMRELVTSVEAMLEASHKALANIDDDVRQNNTVKASSEQQVRILRKVNQLLWKAEVDVENMEDMLRRITARRTDTGFTHFFKKSLGEIRFQDELQKLGEQVRILQDLSHQRVFSHVTTSQLSSALISFFVPSPEDTITHTEA